MEIQIDNLGKVAITVEEEYWSNDRCYDKLVVVEAAGIGAYLSRKPVPKGVSLTNRKYWIKISGNSGSSIPISQTLGYNKDVVVSQKTVTEEIDKLNERIDEIIAGEVTITFTANPNFVTVGQLNLITLSITSDTDADSIIIEDASGNQIGEEGSGRTHSVTTSVTPTTAGFDFVYVAKIKIKSATITKRTYVTVSALSPNISWSANSATVILGEVYTLPSLNNPNNLPITYNSSNTNVAEIDENGTVTIKSLGEAIITASFAGSEIYSPAEVRYTLTVEEETLPVLVGAGPDYSSVTFQETEYKGMPGNMHLVIPVTEGDYVFIKIDKNKDIHTVTTDNENPMWNTPEYFDEPVVDGDYKYYKRTTAYLMSMNARLLVVD